MRMFKLLIAYIVTYVAAWTIAVLVTWVPRLVINGVKSLRDRIKTNKKAKGYGLNKKLYEKIQAGDYIYAKGEVVS